MFSDCDEKFLKKSYIEACEDIEFIKLVKELKVNDEIAMKYTSKLEETIMEKNNCKSCKGIGLCKNKTTGYIDTPKEENNRIKFYNVPCKYILEIQNNNKTKNDITMKDIDITEKCRIPLLKWMAKFLKDLENNKNPKGLYLHGNFGCGKTFLMKALLNEVKKSRASILSIYYPELLTDLKSDFENFKEKIERLKRVEYLLIDDIGAEKVTEWSRDEILGTILQYRMNNNKTTFFTSNLSIENLEKHLAGTNNNIDNIKATRIIERIKYLTDELELLGQNRR